MIAMKRTAVSGAMKTGMILLVLLGLFPGTAQAQLDPLLFLKDPAPNVLLRRRHRPTDAARRAERSVESIWDKQRSRSVHLHIQRGKPAECRPRPERRQYQRELPSKICRAEVCRAAGLPREDLCHGRPVEPYSRFEAPTRLSVARAALDQVIRQNQNVARFGLFKMRQGLNLTYATQGNSGPVVTANGSQSTGDWTPAMALWWAMSRSDRFVGERKFDHYGSVDRS